MTAVADGSGGPVMVAPDLRHRPDIDGLRAIAVLAVVLFHAEFEWIQGGYVGVDVFFVLSGYLITQRIVAAHEGDGFRFRDFWRRRVRRLMPAATATVVVTMLAGVLLLPAGRWPELGTSGAAALTSWSNVLFAASTGYWDAAALDRPLLHTWSLSVEEQFYLVWPLLLVLTLRRRRPLAVLLAVGGVAAVVSIAVTEAAPNAAFYLTPFRIHEFVIGGALVWFDRHRWPDATWAAVVRPLMVVVGVGAIVWSSLAYGPTTAFPGVAVLVPVLGTAFVVGAREPAPLAPLLAAPALQTVGRASYALYLVHWPVLVFVAAEVGEFDGPALVLAAVVTVLGTWALHRGVEERLRRPRPVRARDGSSVAVPVLRVVAAAGAAAVVGVAVTVAGPIVERARFTADVPVADAPSGPTASTDGAADGSSTSSPLGPLLVEPPVRTPAEAVLRGLADVNLDRRERHDELCRRGERNRVCGVVADGARNVLVIGDSQTLDAVNGWAAARPDDVLLASGVPGCPPLRSLTGVVFQEPDCAEINDVRFAELERLAPDLDVVVVGMRATDARLDGIADLVGWLRSLDPALGVAVLGAGHEFRQPASEQLVERGSAGLDQPAELEWLVAGRPDVDRRYRQVVELAGGTYLPRFELFCLDGTCQVLVPDGSATVVHDYTHLTLEAAELAGASWRDTDLP